MKKITDINYIDLITKTSLDVLEKEAVFIDGYESGDETIAFVSGVTGAIDKLNSELLEQDTYNKINESLLQPRYDELDKIARMTPLFEKQLSDLIIELIENLKTTITETNTKEQVSTIISTTFDNFRNFSVFMGGIKKEQFLDFLNKKESEYINIVKTLFT